jgi:DNA-binding NtrC family response regulator
MIPNHYLAGAYHEARGRLIAEFEERYFAQLVQQADGNMSEAARIARVDRTTLYRLIGRRRRLQRRLRRNGRNGARARAVG